MRYFAIAAGFAFAVTAMLALGPAKAETLKSDGKCWLNTSNANYVWAACPKEAKEAKVIKVSKETHRKESAAAKPQNR
jgi:hypothetical protein